MCVIVKKITIFMLALFAINANCFASSDSSINKKNPNHFYVGPEVFAFDLHTHVKDVNIDGTRCFAGLKLRYEYLKPKAFYAGVDLLIAWGGKRFKPTSKRYQFSGNGECGFGNFELRLGYTFEQESGVVSPYLGMGGYVFGSGAFNEVLVYVATGMRSLFEVTQRFSMGLNVKLQLAPEAEREFRYRYQGHKTTLRKEQNMWGGEIGLPLLWYLSKSKRWQAQLEPYFLSLNFIERQNIYGARLLFGYCF